MKTSRESEMKQVYAQTAIKVFVDTLKKPDALLRNNEPIPELVVRAFHDLNALDSHSRGIGVSHALGLCHS